MYKGMTYAVLGTLVGILSKHTHTDWLECYENKHVLWSFEINDITVCVHILYIVHVVIYLPLGNQCDLSGRKNVRESHLTHPRMNNTL